MRTPPSALSVTPGRRLIFFLAIDALIVAGALLGALALRLDGAVPRGTWLRLIPLLAVSVVVTLAALASTRTYRAPWSFFGLRDVARVGLGVAIATTVIGLAALAAGAVAGPALAGISTGIPRSVILIQAPLTFCAISAVRLSKRAVRAYLAPRGAGGVGTLLVGWGDHALQVLRSINEGPARGRYHVVGFLDDDPLAAGQRIDGVPVLGRTADLSEVMARTGAKCVIICLANATGGLVTDVTERARAGGATTVRIVPRLHEIVDGNVTVEATREVRLEDLLGRERIEIDAAEIDGMIGGRRVLVTGGAGTIGSELCRQIARRAPAELTILDVDETRLHDLAHELREAHPGVTICEALVDVRQLDDLRQTFDIRRPDLVFHAAAFKHVPMMEQFPLAAVDVNVLGTLNTAGMAEAFGCERFVLVSTDKAVEPSSIMGASKRIAELVLFSERPSPGPRRMIRSAVRFGNVIGSRGSVIPTFERQLRHGGPLTVTHPDVERFFMLTSEAVSLVLQAAALGRGNEIFVLDMGKPVRIESMARSFIQLQGLEVGRDIQIVYTGLRPGEKLLELLSYPNEALAPTRHGRVMRTEPISAPEFDGASEAVRTLVADRDVAGAREYLQRLFPSLLAHSAARPEVTTRRS